MKRRLGPRLTILVLLTSLAGMSGCTAPQGDRTLAPGATPPSPVRPSR